VLDETYHTGLVGEGDNVDEIVVAESVKDIVHYMSSDLSSYTRHTAGDVHEDQNVFGTGGRLDVPASRSAIEQIWIHVPIRGRILTHEASRTSKILPG